MRPAAKARSLEDVRRTLGRRSGRRPVPCLRADGGLLRAGRAARAGRGRGPAPAQLSPRRRVPARARRRAGRGPPGRPGRAGVAWPWSSCWPWPRAATSPCSCSSTGCRWSTSRRPRCRSTPPPTWLTLAVPAVLAALAMLLVGGRARAVRPECDPTLDAARGGGPMIQLLGTIVRGLRSRALLTRRLDRARGTRARVGRPRADLLRGRHQLLCRHPAPGGAGGVDRPVAGLHARRRARTRRSPIERAITASDALNVGPWGTSTATLVSDEFSALTRRRQVLVARRRLRRAGDRGSLPVGSGRGADAGLGRRDGWGPSSAARWT